MPDACKSCRAPIVWAVTAKNGKAIPIDPVPTYDGNIRLENRDEQRQPPIAHVVGAQQELVRTPRYTSHFATCPDAAKFRQQQTKKPTVAGRMKATASLTVKDKKENPTDGK